MTNFRSTLLLHKALSQFVYPMDFVVLPLLSTRSKRAATRDPKTKRRGRWQSYYPRHALMERLKRELNMGEEAVLEQLYKEVEWYTKRNLRT